MNGLYEEEQRLREEQHGNLVKAEKRANDLNLEIEEVKSQLEQVWKGEKWNGQAFFFCQEVPSNKIASRCECKNN